MNFDDKIKPKTVFSSGNNIILKRIAKVNNKANLLTKGDPVDKFYEVI